MTIDPALALTERLEDRRSPVRQGRSAAPRRETSRWRKREALGVRRSRHRRSLLREVLGVKGVGPHRGRLDAHEDDALAPLERARAVDVAPDRFDLVDPSSLRPMSVACPWTTMPIASPSMWAALHARLVRRCRRRAARPPVRR